jgi:hypothetical protein
MSKSFLDMIEEDALEARIPSDEELSSIAECSKELIALDQAIRRVEEHLSEMRKKQLQIQFKTLPEHMDRCGLSRIDMDGYKLHVEPYVYADVTKEFPRRAEALAWIEENHPELLKGTVSVTFTKDNLEEAVALKQHVDTYLKRRNRGPTSADLRTEVHHSTLTKFVKDEHEAGHPLPLDLLNATVGRIVKIDRKKDNV